MSLYLLLEIFIAYVLDILLEDPPWLPQPVKFLKWLIKHAEKLIRSIVEVFSAKKVKALGDDVVRNTKKKKRNEKIAGVVLAIFITAFAFFSVYIIIRAAYKVHPVLASVINIYFIYTAFAARRTAAEGFKVFDALKERDIFRARKFLSTVAGKHTENLDEKEVIKGAVEATAESTSDNVIAPVFYTFAGSFFGLAAPFVYAFKAISTLDSMVGYKNEKYRYLGWASARLDDIANFIPARLTGILIVVSAFISQNDYSSSYAIMRRDRRKHFSPNSGYPEAAVAGALGVRLGGSGLYFGDIVEKPIIGDPVNELDIRNITQAIVLMYIASALSMVLFTIFYISVYFLKGFFA
ncbi:adenosylcobinamide-phosphate synthase CbiB [Acetivibrio saccincola]|jgi:adenosylcobinamide-phosphate synthase|uniref:Cobalamin biosynthesis protein CobD n=1 Tax=Acetivibrio saccincola TaxID=1677857 RepID=A0A2K9ES28_9FIRM|nr:adenosylcobinamide-phosphate synthase CbiB [Acetivibrio saccincola]AUG58350.1 cobalamin biosynthesis protein [Acetivibrio saccincola]NLW27147.1 cobalamin biosynthesis protein CobD [Acetivibrio saccincola]PQQ66431.1 cobalamin biosynthesis protein CobD [Acetivibrio saccincola]HOA96987.1 adenosylcobinamide-phosphate synthase CbiB [Acetivibrio saccincola]HQD27910.1 adenosylcobinamide-phosphate synthase CbiB [Acetivibrio saccincola]